MPDERWWIGREAVQIVGHSAYGGGVPVIFTVMDATAELGMKPVLLATHPDVVTAARTQGREVWAYPGIVREPHAVHDLLTAVRLSRSLRRRGVRIVHTHTSKGGMVGRLAARLAGCDVVIHHTHGFYHAGLKRGIKRSFMRSLERFFGRMDDRQVFINSQEFDEAVAERIATPLQARLCFNGIEAPAGSLDDPAAVRARFGLPTGGPIVGSVCRIDFEQKGLDVGLRAFARVAEQVPEAVWVIAGTGDDAAEMDRRVTEAGLADRVLLLGHVVGAGAMHRAFDITFAPSRREGQSVSVLEAMACATPCVTTRISGNEDLVEQDVTGVMVSVDDVDAMVAELVALLGDGERRRRMGANALASYERTFTRDALLGRVKALYLDALAGEVALPITITPMRDAHVSDVVNVHLASFRGFFLTELGPAFLRAYYRGAVRDPSATALVAMSGGRVVGFVVGSGEPGGFYGRLLRRGWLRFGVAALPAVLRRPAVVGRVLRAVRKPAQAATPAGVAGLYSLAVSPDGQGRGVGGALVERFCAELDDAGSERVRLETDASGNDAVNAFYRAHGFDQAREYTTPEGRRMLEYERDLRKGADSREC